MAKVRAPISGTITQVRFSVPGMYAPRGATLLSIAQDVDAPHIAFDVSVAFVDQLAVGMTGTLNIPALPQRTMSKVAVTVMAISLRAEVDEAGNPAAFPSWTATKDTIGSGAPTSVGIAVGPSSHMLGGFLVEVGVVWKTRPRHPVRRHSDDLLLGTSF